MSTQTAHEDVRIVGSFGDGGRPSRRALMPTAVGAITGLVVVGVLAALGGPTSLWFAPTLVAAGVAAGHDVHSGRLPDPLVATTALLGLVGAVAAGGTDGALAFLTGALALAAPLLVFHLASPCSMAFGDVKFAGAIGGLVGIAGADTSDRLPLAMTALTVASAVAVIGAVAARSRQAPFGPALYVGTCTIVVVASVTRNPFA